LPKGEEKAKKAMITHQKCVFLQKKSKYNLLGTVLWERNLPDAANK